jgi:calcineurin-like phosphoesterase family protein
MEHNMPASFVVSDTHFGHAGVCKFTEADGVTKIRPWTDPEQMNEDMIRMWNDTVRPGDKVYHLGDVVINRRYLPVLDRLNGDKVLIKGNHDIFRLEEYTKYFRDIRAYHVLNGLILSHIPVHADSLARFGCNIHGHLHTHRVMKPIGVDARTGTVKYGNEIDPRYFNVSVEQIGFKPMLFEDVCKSIIAQGGEVGFKYGNGSQPVM